MGQTHWGWLVAIYLFLGGMGAGSLLTAAVVELTGERYKHAFCPTTLIGASVSGPLVIIGSLLLIFDLGAGKMEPWRIIYMFTHFTSVMTWGIWLLTLFIPVSLLYGLMEIMDNYPGILAWLRRFLKFLPAEIPYRSIRRVLASVGAVLAVGVGIYTGILLSVVRAVPLWNTPLLPLLFLVSAGSTGMGLTIDLGATMAVPDVARRFHALPIIHIVLIGLEAVLIGLVLAAAWLKGGVAAESALLMVSGPHSIIFWAFVVFPGLFFPFVVHAYAIGARRHGAVSGILSGAGIVIAGLFLRYLIVFSGIPVAL